MSDELAAPVTAVAGTGIPVKGNDIDTDQIIPARFMKVVTFEGLGQFAFFDQRFDDDDNQKEHPFNDARFQDASILVVNANFGCGSSREHAPQALMRWGIDAVIGESFAEIFAGNCLAMGIPTVTADTTAIETLQATIEASPETEIAIDITEESVTYNGTTMDASIDDSHRDALINGAYDTTAVMHSNLDQVRQTAESIPYLND